MRGYFLKVLTDRTKCQVQSLRRFTHETLRVTKLGRAPHVAMIKIKRLFARNGVEVRKSESVSLVDITYTQKQK